jgi:hypothetical protein
MLKSLILGAALGGITLFLWGAVSWMVMPWHMHGMHKFEDEAQVAQVLTENAPVSGMYLLPNALHAPNLGHPEQATKERADAVARMQQGPYAFVAVTLNGMDPKKPDHYLNALAVDVACALLVSWLLMQTQGLGYLRRVWFVTVVGLLIGAASELPNWIWWRFSDNFTVIGLLDALVGWFLAGIVIARFAPGQRPSLPTFR